MAITTRETTATGVTNKGSPLTNAEVDNNFVEIVASLSDKLETVAVDDLSDVTITSVQNGDILKYNGTAWVNDTESGGAEVNDLTSSVTWANVPDANITESSVTQHEAALTISSTQVSDFAEAVDDEVNTLLQAGLGVDLTYDDVNNELTIDSNHVEVNCTNQSGASIPIGTPVYQTGVSGNNITIAPADADDSAKMPAIGMTTSAIANGAEGTVVILGVVNGLDTSAFTAGDTVYVSTTAGALTTTAPTGESGLIQNFGRVLKVNAASGSIAVMGAGRANAVANLNNGNVFIGNASNQAETRALTASDIQSGSFADARIAQSNVTQHQAALSVTESQISDLGAYITASSTDTLTNKSGNISQWTNDSGYLTGFTETDPTVPSHVKSITTTEKSNWNTAYSWGNHASAGYLTSYTETDPVFSASAASGITSTNITNWNTAYSWGNHASAGYASASSLSGYVSRNFEDSSRNLVIPTNTTSGSAGLAMETSAGTFLFQVYGTGTQFGFLDAQWGNWDLKKTSGGNLEIDISGTLRTVWHTGNFTSTDVSNWNTAYGWGNHASAGYAVSNSTASFGSTTFSVASGAAIKVKDTNAVGQTQMNTWVQFYDSANTEMGYLGYGSGSNNYLYLNNQNGDVSINGSNIRLGANTTITGTINASSSITGTQVYAQDWFRNDNAGEGLYNQALAGHFFQASSQYWHLNTASSATYGGLILYGAYNATAGNVTSRKGYLFWDASGFGLLNSGSGWSVRTTSSETRLYNNVTLDSISEAPSEWNPVLLSDGGIIKQDSAVQIHGAGYLMAQYLNMTHGATTRSTDTTFYSSNDDYVRKNNATGFRASLNVPTRTGGDASGTWGISITGSSASCTGNAATATNADQVDGIEGANILNKQGTSYYQLNTWLQGTAGHGLYFPSSGAGTHFYPSDLGNYGSFRVDGRKGGWSGISLESRAVFMHDGASGTGIFNDVHNHWLFYGVHTDKTAMYFNGAEKIYTYASGGRVTGDFLATGDVYAYYSDERLKEKTGKIENALDKVDAIETFYYTHNDKAVELGYEGKEQQVGVSAQSVAEVMPEVVHLAPIDDDGKGNSISGENYQTVNYARLVPLLIESIKELRAEIEELKRGV